MPVRTPARVVVRVPAKLNLHLSVGPLRADGFHELTTVFHAVSLTDEVTVRPADRLSVSVTGEGAEQVPIDGTNLAVRAAALLAEHTGHEAHAAIGIRKGIPVAGGCAGGSADAAATLVACNALWGTELDTDALAGLAARLGSDVPFCLQGRTALGTGRGEQLTPVLGRGSYAWVLALAHEGLSTPAVYRRLDDDRESRPAVAADPADVLAALRRGDATLLGRALHNDLQPPAVALRPTLQTLLDLGDELGALGGMVSGSGPTVAFLARDPDHADELSAHLSGSDICRAVRRADGPVAGARVVG